MRNIIKNNQQVLEKHHSEKGGVFSLHFLYKHNNNKYYYMLYGDDVYILHNYHTSYLGKSFLIISMSDFKQIKKYDDLLNMSALFLVKEQKKVANPFVVFYNHFDIPPVDFLYRKIKLLLLNH